jgi:hypothetical protein
MPFLLPVYAGDFRAGIGSPYHFPSPAQQREGAQGRKDYPFVSDGSIFYTSSPAVWHSEELYNKSLVRIKNRDVSIRWRQPFNGASPFHPVERSAEAHAKKLCEAAKWPPEDAQKQAWKTIFPGTFLPHLSSLKTSVKIPEKGHSFMEEYTIKTATSSMGGQHFPPSQGLNDAPEEFTHWFTCVHAGCEQVQRR